MDESWSYKYKVLVLYGKCGSEAAVYSTVSRETLDATHVTLRLMIWNSNRSLIPGIYHPVAG
jgi:hypothetical protein